MILTKHSDRNSLLKILILIIITVAAGLFLISEEKKTEKEIESLYAVSMVENSPIVLMFVGDIMLDRGVEYIIEKEGGDFKFPFLKIAAKIKEADILFGNLESVISDKGENVGSIYSFRADPKTIDGLVFAGFDILSVANNHVFDYGRSAMEDSFNRLKSADINYVGGGFNETEASFPVIKNIKGTKIAFLAYNGVGLEYWSAKKDKSGIAWLDEEKLANDIKLAKGLADLVIVSMHFGEEYQSESNSEQKKLARLAIDSGANLVVGHHPHVAQEIEKYDSGHIAYSLGNFIFDQDFSEETKKGILLKIIVQNKRIIRIISAQTEINQYFQPEILN
jgi:poly-gamma-glutamate synthesis protein (capsule biosynthesis protein)